MGGSKGKRGAGCADGSKGNRGADCADSSCGFRNPRSESDGRDAGTGGYPRNGRDEAAEGKLLAHCALGVGLLRVLCILHVQKRLRNYIPFFRDRQPLVFLLLFYKTGDYLKKRKLLLHDCHASGDFHLLHG